MNAHTATSPKSELRRRMRAVLAAIAPEMRAKAAHAIVKPIVDAAGAGPVALFASMSHELDTSLLDDALRERGVVRLYPEVRGDEIVFRALPAAVRARDMPAARFGAPTPPVDFASVPLAKASLVVVPGLAFDLDGGRIGHGRGFYDRALASSGAVARAVGLCFDEQIVEAVPMEERDVRLTRLCTPSRGVIRLL